MKKVKDAPKARGRGPESPNPSKRSVQDQVEFALAWLKGRSTRVTLEGMARYSIPSDHAYGVAMKDIKALGTMLGRNQRLAVALWETGVYEARMLASFVGDPERLTAAQMERWCKDFDNWAFCDAMSFNCSTGRRTRGPRSSSGAAGATSSRSARRLRCYGVSPCTTRVLAMSSSNRASPS